MEMRKRHLLRISSIEAGKSNLDADFEREMIKAFDLDTMVDPTRKSQREVSVETIMLNAAKEVPVWDWMTSIRGLAAGGLAAQLLAQIDDIGKFDTVSKLWRFAGYAVIDGEIEHPEKGEKLHYNKTLKSLVYQASALFLKMQTSPYADIYYEEKDKQRQAHPVVICKECWTECREGKNGDDHTTWRCPENSKHHPMFTPAHLHNRALRKVSKIFLSHLWLKWREAEGLPVSQPYAQAILGHSNLTPA
jgi:hypothetical protein